MIQRTAALAAVSVLALSLGGCSAVSKATDFVTSPFSGPAKNKAVATEGERVSIIAFDEKVEVNEALKGQDFLLPEPAPMAAWPLPGGGPEQSVENVAAAAQFEVAWRKGFGKGSERDIHVTAPPVSADGKIFVMDAEATVSAIDAKTGATLWRQNLRPNARRDRISFGGGLAYADGKLYVASGYRFVTQLDAATGKQGWTQAVTTPIHGAPNVSGGRVFVISTDNELMTFDTASGTPGWTYQALIEPARILKASSPAVSGDTVVAAFASGEVVALRASNGNDLWNEALSRASRNNALSEIRDVAGRPVIYRGDVFAISHSGVFTATDLRTGEVRWSLPVIGVTSPLPVGDVVYAVSKSGQVICVSRETGQVYWIRELNANLSKGQLKKERKQPTIWSSPLLASGRLIVVSSKGDALALDPKTGATTKSLKLGDPALLAPIAVGDMVYVATDAARLVAIR
jgi:outer membrane protein assembly factor BamB